MASGDRIGQLQRISLASTSIRFFKALFGGARSMAANCMLGVRVFRPGILHLAFR